MSGADKAAAILEKAERLAGRSLGENGDALTEMAGVFGILTRKADDGDEKVKTLLEARAKARAEKNWAESDRLRDEIAALGYVLKDTKQGQQVTKAM